MSPPRPPPLRRFTLPGVAWLAAGACAFAPLAGSVKLALNGSLSAYGALVALGLAAAFFLLPLGAAWAASRLFPAHARAPSGAFFVMLVAVAGTVFWRAALASRQREQAAQAHARALARQMIHRETAGATPATTPDASLPETSEPILAAQRAVKARLDAVQLAYDDAAAPVASDTFFDLRPLTSREVIAARRQQVQTFTRAIQLLRESNELGAFYFSSELRDRNVPEDAVRSAVMAYRAATEKQLPRMKRLREKDGGLALLMGQFLDFAESRLGQWRVDPATGTIEFDQPAAKDRHENLLRTARVLENDRHRLRGELGK